MQCQGTAFLARERLRTKALEISRGITCGGDLLRRSSEEDRSTNHRYGQTATMILLCEHPAVVAGPVRKWKTFFVFQGAFLAPSFAGPVRAGVQRRLSRSSFR